MENVPPPNDNPNAPEEEPFMDPAPAAFVGFAPQWIGEQIPNNNNVRANTSESSKMMRLITDLRREFSELKCQNRRAKELSRWEAWVRGRIPNNLRFQEELSIYIAPVPCADDPYVMVRDAARGTREDED
nr:hypothetical protein [Tanacetum cinerariifolium]